MRFSLAKVRMKTAQDARCDNPIIVLYRVNRLKSLNWLTHSEWYVYLPRQDTDVRKQIYFTFRNLQQNMFWMYKVGLMCMNAQIKLSWSEYVNFLLIGKSNIEKSNFFPHFIKCIQTHHIFGLQMDWHEKCSLNWISCINCNHFRIYHFCFLLSFNK